MYLRKLILHNFKNYEEQHLDFIPGINCLVGENGAGKTNLLDAIHVLSLTKSAFNPVDSQNIRKGLGYYAVNGQFETGGTTEEVICGFQIGKSKSVKLNKVEYDKLSLHIGKFPLVLIAPNDSDLIREGNEVRRKFLDGIIAQHDAAYLNDLIRYNHFLKQRNALLKNFNETRVRDLDLLFPYDKNLKELAAAIYSKRVSFFNQFIPFFNQHYAHVSGNKEEVNIQYKSQVEDEDFPSLFHSFLEKDIYQQRTNAGIHKDEIVFEIEDMPLKKFGSQGQQKSFAISLKLAQYDCLHAIMGKKPLLLLDDVFDKLDDLRIKHLLGLMAENHFGQIFLTDARPERTASLLESVETEKKIFNVINGVVKVNEP